MRDKPIITFDSNVLTAFVSATDGTDLTQSTDPQLPEWIATFRLFLFCDASIVATVTTEAEAIRDTERQEAHLRAIGLQFNEIIPDDHDIPALRHRADEFARIRTNKKGFNDCLILATTEAAKIPILATLDDTFRKKLGSTTAVKLLTPVDACQCLGIPDNAKPYDVPDRQNPLRRQTWWHWPGLKLS